MEPCDPPLRRGEALVACPALPAHRHGVVLVDASTLL